MLHPVSDQEAYCGPTAIAAVTGRDVTEIGRLIREAGPRYSDPARRIVGMGNEELLETMHRLGWRVAEKWEDPAYGRETGNWGWQGRKHQFSFADFLETHAEGGPFIVTAGHHYLAVGAGKIVDTSHRKGVKAKTYVNGGTKRWIGPHRAPRARVSEWFRFELASPLAILADRINAEHEKTVAGFRTGAKHAIACGKLLLEAKAQIEHGKWGAWLKDNFRASGRTARLYMWLAENASDWQRVADLGLRGLVKHLKLDPPPVESQAEKPRASEVEQPVKVECEPEVEQPVKKPKERRVRDEDGNLVTKKELLEKQKQERKKAEREREAQDAKAREFASWLIANHPDIARKLWDLREADWEFWAALDKHFDPEQPSSGNDADPEASAEAMKAKYAEIENGEEAAA
jgi:hypothetical protein